MEIEELYYIILLSKKYGKVEMPYDIDRVWNNIKKYYYMENNIYIDDNDILFAWLKEKARYPLLDSLVLQVFDKFVNDENILNKVDPFFISNILQLRDIIASYGKMIKHDYKEISNLSKMKKNTVIDTVSDILLEIDPTGEWKEIYEEIMDGHIVYVDTLNEEEKKSFEDLLGIRLSKDDDGACVFLNDSKKAYVFLTYTGTISDVVTTVHEVVHYISRYKNDWHEEAPILREFSSTFFELYAMEYLKKIGYDETELKMINKSRISEMTRLLDDALIISDYLITFMKNGKIDEYTHVLDDCKADRCIDLLINNPYLLNDYYPYLFGDYLANKAMKMISSDKQMMSIIKYVTDNLAKMKAINVFDLVGCGDANFVEYDDSLFPKKKKRIK